MNSLPNASLPSNWEGSGGSQSDEWVTMRCHLIIQVQRQVRWEETGFYLHISQGEFGCLAWHF